MFNLIRKFSNRGSEYSHTSRHGYKDSGKRRCKNSICSGLPLEKGASQCQLCERHCPLSEAGCPKGKMYTKQKTQKENNIMINENSNRQKADARAETLIRLFRRALKAISRAHHSRGNVQHAQARVLAILMEKEPMIQADLMKLLNVRSASLSEILAKLEKSECISRVRSEQDKRNFIISVTEQGRGADQEHKKDYLESAEAIFAPLSADERLQLEQILRKIIIPLEKDDLNRDDHHGHESGRRHGRGHSKKGGRHLHGHHARSHGNVLNPHDSE